MLPVYNYGQQAFERFKAFRIPGRPGGIAIFRPERNVISTLAALMRITPDAAEGPFSHVSAGMLSRRRYPTA